MARPAARKGLGLDVRGAMAHLLVRRDRVVLEGRGSLAGDLGPAPRRAGRAAGQSDNLRQNF